MSDQHYRPSAGPPGHGSDARSSPAISEHNTSPLELQGFTTTATTPQIYALGTVPTAVSIFVIALAIALLRARQARFRSDIGKGMV